MLEIQYVNRCLISLLWPINACTLSKGRKYSSRGHRWSYCSLWSLHAFWKSSSWGDKVHVQVLNGHWGQLKLIYKDWTPLQPTKQGKKLWLFPPVCVWQSNPGTRHATQLKSWVVSVIRCQNFLHWRPFDKLSKCFHPMVGISLW